MTFDSPQTQSSSFGITGELVPESPQITKIHEFETQGYRGPTPYLLKTNLHISEPMKFKPLLFKSQL